MQTSKKKRTIVPWNQHTKSNASLEGANKPAKNTIGSAKDIWHVGGEREFGVEGDAEVPNFAHLFKLMLGPTQLPNAKVVPLLSYSATHYTSAEWPEWPAVQHRQDIVDIVMTAVWKKSKCTRNVDVHWKFQSCMEILCFI